VTDLLQIHADLVLLALDQMSLYHQATLTRVWAPVGQTPIIRLHSQRNHVHFYGALELRTGREIALPADEQNSLTTASFIRILLLLYPTQHILLLLDRAPWHFGDEVGTLFAENEDRLDVMYFPPACPDLNPQEHVWSQARDNVSHNHTYPAFQTLIDDFEDYLNKMPFETNFMEKYAPLHLGDYASSI
jgi:transposase